MYYKQFRKGKRTEAKTHYGDLFSERFMVLRFGLNYEFAKNVLNSNRKVSVLDVGGYTADNLKYWLIQGENIKKIEYHVADYDTQAGKIAKSRGAIPHYYDLNIDNLLKLFPTKKFDLIICTEVLEHLLDPHRQMDYFKKLLKPNGKVIISLPNENTIFHRIYSVLGLGIDQYPFVLYKHLHFPTVKQSFDFVKNYFTVIDKSYYMNFGGGGSRFGYFGKVFTLIPDSIWRYFVDRFPSLLARGTVFYLSKKKSDK